jgi:hypothetical protein
MYRSLFYSTYMESNLSLGTKMHGLCEKTNLIRVYLGPHPPPPLILPIVEVISA